MFRTTRLSARSAPVHGGPGRPRRGTWRHFHAFADDTQLLVHCRRDEVTSTVLRLENCIEEVSLWMSANHLKLNADETELLWAGSRHGPALVGSAGSSLLLRTKTIAASDKVRVLGITMTSDLSLDEHVANGCATCFNSTGFASSDGSDVHSTQSLRLRWSRLLWRHMWTTATLFSLGHPSPPQTSSSELNAAARIVSDTRKYDRGLTNLLHDELHWLDVPQRVQYKLCATVHRCLQHKAPQYMTDCCIHTSDIARRLNPRSPGCRQLFVPRHRRSMFSRRAFSLAGPAAWNSLPDYLLDQTRSFGSFIVTWKLFSFYCRKQRIGGFAIMRYINLLLTLT